MYTYLHTPSRHDSLPLFALRLRYLRHHISPGLIGHADRRNEAAVIDAKRIGDTVQICLAVAQEVVPVSLAPIWRIEGQNNANIAVFRGFDIGAKGQVIGRLPHRSEEHTSELQSLMRISYAVFCLKKKINTQNKSS